MDECQKFLFGRLQVYDLIGDGSPVSLSGKLARQNRWSRAFALRVIEEYKRFAFLSVAAGHPVSPSDVVDQAWHLHLMYTEDYWKEFCPNVLGRELHHQPSSGKPGEGAKFADWYSKTLESYERLFGVVPPADIWPRPQLVPQRKTDHVRIDQAAHWIVPKPAKLAVGRTQFSVRGRSRVFAFVGESGRAHRLGKWFGGLCVVALIAVGCTGAAVGVNPLDWQGPDFLEFFVVASIVSFLFCGWIRWRLLQPATGDMRLTSQLEPCEVAYLKDGPFAAVDVAITGLLLAGKLEVNPATRMVQAVPGAPAPDGPIESSVLRVVESFQSGRNWWMRSLVARELNWLKDSLKDHGLFVTDEQAAAVVWVPFLLSLLVPMVGAAKVYVGVSRDRPVGFLVALLLLSGFFNLCVFLKKPVRSRFGDAVLQTILRKHGRYRQLASMGPEIAPDEMMLGVALFGTSALVGTALDAYALTMVAPNSYGSNSGCSSNNFNNSNCGSSTTTNSCSSGGDAGGSSSCGGGGDSGGGGGCGGCSSN